MSGDTPTLGELAAQAVQRYRHRPCLTQGDRTLDFGEFDELARRIALQLQRALPAHSRVALFTGNRFEYLVLQSALEYAGLVRVPLNARYTAIEVRNVLDDCGASALFYDAGTADVAHEALACRAGLWSCMVGGAAAHHGAQWDELTAPAEDKARPRFAGADDLCSINYTSGSSGRPKGVMMTFRNWAIVCRNMLIDRDIRGDDVLAHIGPLTHASGTYFMPWFLRGAHQVVVEPGPIEHLLAAIERHRVSVFTCVPTVLTRIVNAPDLDRYDLRSIRAIGYGAEPIPANTLDKALRTFGPILTQNYGLTEAMMTVSTLAPADHFVGDGAQRRVRVGSIGRPYTFVEVVLRNPDGVPVAEGEVGEITIRSDHVMKGYWNAPDATADALREGWLWSGDLATMDGDGFITLVGRRKEMLISGGFNIYPQELEAVLGTHPQVTEAAVVGVADPDWGEIAVAFVSTADCEPAVASDALAEYCKPRLGIRTPKRFVVLPSLPKTPNGKIDKRALRARASGEEAA